jgi:hypothetical protein
MKIFMLVLMIVLLAAAFAIGVIFGPRIPIPSPPASEQISTVASTNLEYWLNRYQTFLGVLVAVIVAWLTISATSKQTSISERQFLSSQIQELQGDQSNLQLIIAQLNDLKTQQTLFANNLAFLETAGDQINGWQNGPNNLRTAFVNLESYLVLVAANTSKFLGSTAAREALVKKLTEIVEMHEPLRVSFLSWANQNRESNAALGAPPSQEKRAYLDTKSRAVSALSDVKPLAQNVVKELEAAIARTKSDAEVLRKARDAL